MSAQIVAARAAHIEDALRVVFAHGMPSGTLTGKRGVAVSRLDEEARRRAIRIVKGIAVSRTPRF